MYGKTVRKFWDWLTETYRWHCMFDAIRYFPGFVGRCFGYMPIIWRDRDWDYHGILVMLQYKIKRTCHCIGKYGHHENPEEDIKNMERAILLIDRIVECNYLSEEFDAHCKKWNKSGEWLKTVETEDGRHIMAPRSPEEYAEFKAMCDRMQAAEEADWGELWGILNKELRNWWD